MEHFGFRWTDFHEIWYLSIFLKPAEEIQISLKSGKNRGYITWRPIYIVWSYLDNFFLEWKIVQRNVVEKIKTHILCPVTFLFFRKSCRLWGNVGKNVVELKRPQMTIWRMRVATTNTHSEYVILTAFNCNSDYTNAPHC